MPSMLIKIQSQVVRFFLDVLRCDRSSTGDDSAKKEKRKKEKEEVAEAAPAKKKKAKLPAPVGTK